MKKILALILVSLMMLTGCATKEAVSLPEPERIETMDELMEIVNRQHEAIKKPQINFEDYVNDSSEDIMDVFSDVLDKEYDENAILTAEQAENDINFLFQVLQLIYGPYYHFGGDEVFLQARDDIIAQCKEKESLRAGDLSALLIEHLQFIRDAHFTINDIRFSESVLAHIYNQGSAFLKAKETFVTGNGEKTVKSIAGMPPEELLRLSISPEGEVVYYPVLLLESGIEAEPLEVEYTDDSREILIPPEWNSGFEESEARVELREKQGIPVLFACNMYFDKAPGGEDGQAFMDYVKQMKEAPVSMMDIRSNGGGNVVLPLKWLTAFAGGQVTTNHVEIQRWSEEEMLAFAQDTENPFYVPLEDMKTYQGMEPINQNYMKNGDFPDNFVPNESILIVLTGKNTASAGETFVDAATNVENTLIIGNNTFGMLVSNASTFFPLPESGIAIQLGSNLSIFAEGSFEEYVGFSPDLWVSAAEAEDLAVKLVQNLMK